MLEFIIGATLASVVKELRENRVISKVLLRGSAIICENIVAISAITIGISCQIAPGNYMLYSWIVLPLFVLMLPALATVEFRIIKKSEVFSKLISYLSEISYAFFLAQLFIWPIMRRLCSLLNIGNNIAKILLSFIVTTMISIVIHELVEKSSKKILSKRLLRT